MKIFLLEDEIDKFPRNAILEALKGHELTLARSAQEARELYDPPYGLMLLDHDMNGYFEDSSHPNTGYQFCAWLTISQQGSKRSPVLLHSQNPAGRRKMADLLVRHRWTVSEFAFCREYVQHLHKQYGIK